MPTRLILTAVVVIILYQLVNRYRKLSRNVALAKSSGLPVVVSPWNFFSIFWLSTYKLWTPLLRRILPASLQGLWMEYVASFDDCQTR